MTKSVSSGLVTHMDLSSTTLCTCWKLVRDDGTILTFTDHDEQLSFDADGLGVLTYLPNASFSRSAVSTVDNLKVDEVDIAGVFDSSSITESDLLAGKYDDAEVKIFIVNWADPTQGLVKLRRGFLGEIEMDDFGYTAELLGLALPLQRNIVELVSPRCLAELGDSRCQVDLEPSARVENTAYAAKVAKDASIGSVVSATPENNRRFVCTTAGTSAAGGDPAWNTLIGGTTTDGPTLIWTTENSFVKFGEIFSIVSRKEFEVIDPTSAADDYFNRGSLTFSSGTNSGQSREIEDWTDLGSGHFLVRTFLPFSFDALAGDSIKAIIGCLLTNLNCRVPFDNILNARAHFFVPGQDKTLQVQS